MGFSDGNCFQYFDPMTCLGYQPRPLENREPRTFALFINCVDLDKASSRLA